LQEFGPTEATWQSDTTTTVRIGSCRLDVAITGGLVEVKVALAIDMASVGTCTGTVTLQGRVPASPDTPNGSHTKPTPLPPDGHQWDWQAAAARVSAELNMGGQPFVFEGRGYHDQNASSTPLCDHGITRWVWGRLANDDEGPMVDAVVYALWREGGDVDGPPSECTLLRSQDGIIVQEAATMRHGLARTWLGMPRVAAVEAHSERVSMRANSTTCVDKGPFYTRSLWRGHIDGRPASGVVEVVDPARIDIGWQQPFVRMRVAGAESSSPWLPLFAGPSVGRWQRWWRAMTRMS
jgi:hypothetical protein